MIANDMEGDEHAIACAIENAFYVVKEAQSFCDAAMSSLADGAMFVGHARILEAMGKLSAAHDLLHAAETMKRNHSK